MSSLAIFCILLGLLTLVTRGPLAFAPERTLAAWRRLFGNRRATRLSGLLLAGPGLLALNLPSAPGLLPLLVEVWGALATFAAGALLFFPQASQRFALAIYDGFENKLSSAALRGLGVVALAFGAGLVYLGLFVL